MKKRFLILFLTALFALVGAVLRGLNLINGYEPDTQLPVQGDPAETGLIALCVVAAVALLAFALSFRAQRGILFEEAFGGDSVGFKMISVISGILMIASGAFGLYLAVSQNVMTAIWSFVPLLILWLLAILTGCCMIGIASALSRDRIVEGTASLTIIPMFWACFDLIITFKDNGASPFLGLYAFELLAAIALTYAFYVLAGFLYSTASPSRFVLSAGMSVVLCGVCVGGAAIALLSGSSSVPFSTDTLLRYACFFASGLWLFALLALLSRESNRYTAGKTPEI